MRATRILVECPELIASVRVGVLDPLKPLVTDGVCDVQFKRTLEIKNTDIQWADILVCVRGCEYITSQIIAEAKKANRFIIYFLDDDLLDVPRDTSCSDYFNDSLMKENIIKIISDSDVLWGVNELIGNKYMAFCGGRWVCSKVPADPKVLNIWSKSDNEVVKILYAGSTSHENNVRKYLTPVAERIIEKFKNQIEFTFIGVNPGIKDTNHVKTLKTFESYDDYRMYVNNEKFDIGIAVLGEEDFYQYKYYNKFIEYSTIGTVGVYPNQEPYKQIINNNYNGILVENTVSEWVEALSLLIMKKQLREELIVNAQNLLIADFEPMQIASNLMIKIPEISDYRAPDTSLRSINLRNGKIHFYIDRAKYIFRTKKLMAIPIIIMKAIKLFYKWLFLKNS